MARRPLIDPQALLPAPALPFLTVQGGEGGEGGGDADAQSGNNYLFITGYCSFFIGYFLFY